MTYKEIEAKALALEAQVPILRKKWIGIEDFRSGNGKMVSSGVFVKMPHGMALGDSVPERSDYTQCKCLFYQQVDCEAARDALTKLGIEATIVPPHVSTIECDGEESRIRNDLWSLRWELT